MAQNLFTVFSVFCKILSSINFCLFFEKGINSDQCHLNRLILFILLVSYRLEMPVMLVLLKASWSRKRFAKTSDKAQQLTQYRGRNMYKSPEHSSLTKKRLHFSFLKVRRRNATNRVTWTIKSCPAVKINASYAS